ncbi:MAG: alpha/beta hydrolase [Spirochaetales bacterium]|nr:alpha/beta hydrolase [Spirochaetales bacterium]
MVIESSYGPDPSQRGILYLPHGGSRGTVCLFHGGFWKMPYDLHQFDRVCEALMLRGYMVWNIEYRRTGVPGREWTDTFEDAVMSVNHLKELKKQFSGIDLKNLTVMGHSAGGHLALWLGNHPETMIETKLEIRPARIIGLSPITDLMGCYEREAGGNAVEELLQCTPQEDRIKYESASPLELLPLNIPTLIFHGDRDEYVPVEMSEGYAGRSKEFEGDCTLITINGGIHMDFIDPGTISFRKVLDALELRH